MRTKQIWIKILLQVNRKEFVGFHIFIMDFVKLGNISRKMRETSMCKGFEELDMLVKDIP